MKRILLTVIFLAVFFIPRGAAQDLTLTLEEAIQLASRDNRDILLKAQDVEKAKKKISENESGLFPSLTVSGGPSETIGLYSDSLNQTAGQISAKQYLYKGGKTINSIEQSKEKLKVSEALLDKSKLEIVQKVKKAFYTLLLVDRFVQLNQQILDNTQKHLDMLQARYDKGQASDLEILKIKESLASVQKAHTESLGQLEATHSLLFNLLYIEEGAALKVQGDFVYDPKDFVYEQAFLEAVKSRPEIRQYEAQERADKKSIEITKADNRPSVYASWDYYGRSHLTGTTTENWNDYNVVGVTVSWPIFDGWLTKAKLDQAIIDLKETQLTKEKVMKDIALELRNAYVGLRNAVAQVKASESDYAFYQASLQNIQEKYQKGIASRLDLEDAVLSRDVSAFSKNQSIYNYLVSKIDFDKATGGM